MNKNRKIREIILEGTPKERGLIHGETLKSEIEESLERTRYFIPKYYNIPSGILIKEFINNTNFISAAKKWTPGLVKEIEGIAEGADVDFDELFFLQCGDEAGWCFQEMKRMASERCSGLGCFKEGNTPAFVAQTLDWLNINEGLEVIFRIKYLDSSLECLIPSVPGVIGLLGLNNLPIGITTNALWSWLNRSLEGLPVNFIVRGVLEQKSLDNAIEFVKTIQHASAENYIMGNSEKVVNFECSSNKVCQFVPYPNARRVYHTNHPIVNNDLILPPEKPQGARTTWDRFAYLEHRLKDPLKQITLETIKNILRSHFGPICVHHNFEPGGGYTQYAVIYSLKKSPELYITNGSPCLTEFQCYTFE